MFAHRTYKRRSPEELVPIRKEVTHLFDEAEKLQRAGDAAMASRRVRAARRAAMKVQLRMKEEGERFCRACDAYLIPGANVTVRIKDGIRIRKCLACGAVRRRVVKK